MKPAGWRLAQVIGLLLFLPLLASLISSAFTLRYIVSVREDARSIDVAGYQRMLAVEIKDWAGMVGGGQEEDRPGLLSRMREFEINLTAMQHGGETSKGPIGPAPAELQEKLSAMRAEWTAIKTDIATILKSPRASAKPRYAVRRVMANCEQLRDRADRIVSALAERYARMRDEMLSALAATALLNITVFFIGLAVVRSRIVGPLLSLGTAVERMSRGDFSRKVRLETRDEMSMLAEAFNSMGSEIERLVGELRENEQRFHQITDNIDEVFWISAPDRRRMIYVSPAYERIWGRPCAWRCADSREWLQDLHPDDEDRIRRVVDEKDHAGKYDEKYRIVRPDGTMRWIRERAFPVKDAAGNVCRIVGVTEDITERTTAEAMLAQSQKMSAIGQLAAGVAHEINNPVGVILGFAQSLAKRLKEDDPYAMPVKSIEREAQRCKILVQNLLTFSRKDEANMTRLDLNEAVESVVGLIEAQARIKSVAIVKDYGSLQPIRGDMNQLQQVVINLCGNALDAMPGGGRLTLSTRHRTLEDRGECVLVVEDTGGGIPQDIQKNIFDPFFTTKEPGKGTGLGLSLVYEIVKKHGGRIEVRSEAGRGAAFTASFPVIPPGDGPSA